MNKQIDAPEDKKAIHSMDELAALMASNREQMREAGKYPSLKKTSPNKVNEEVDDTPDDNDVEDVSSEDIDDGVSLHDADNVGVEDDTDQSSSDEADSMDAADVEDAESDDALAQAEFEINDEDLIEIEGLDEPVSFKKLKDVYQADKTVVNRVEQTEIEYNRATETYQKAVEDSERVHNAMTALIKGIDSIMTQPLVSKPSDALKKSNPQQYISHLEAYEQDQQRINDSRNTVLQALDEHRKQSEEAHKNLKIQEIGRLREKLPALKNPETTKQASMDIIAAAQYFGFTPEEINKAADHRLFLMAHMAQQYMKLKGLSKEEKEERTTTIKRRIASQPKILRSKGTQPRASAQVKQVKKIKNVATQTGKPKDVAAFMAANRRLHG